MLSSEIRRLIRTRDHDVCQKCGFKSGDSTITIDGQAVPLDPTIGNPINIHHILPRQYGGSDEPSNLITLCRICHSKMHVEFQARYFSGSLLQMFHLMFLRIKSFFTGDKELSLYRALKFLTGSTTFHFPQKEIIQALMAGNNVLVVMPTGKGKSICYQLPGLLMPGRSLVISPLKSLIKDQVKSLHRHYVTTTYIDSDLDKKEAATRIDFIRQGLFKFVYLTPERFSNEYNDYEVANDNPLLLKYNLMAIDEAHTVEKWGRLFRPAYARLDTLRSKLGNPPTIVLTASASRRVQKEIVKSVGIENAKVFVMGIYRPEIALRVVTVNPLSMSKERIIGEILLSHPDEKTIIFVPTINVGEQLYEALQKSFNIAIYHSRRSEPDRRLIQERFSGSVKPELNILIATSAFGMGVNVPNVRRVIHYSLTPNIEDYYQQIGRAGRDGAPSEGILLYQRDDEGLIRYVSEKHLEKDKRKTKEEKARLTAVHREELQTMLDYIRAEDKWKFILNYFGETSVPQRNKFMWVILAIGIVLFIIWILHFARGF